jgi:MFS family permease
MTGSRVAEDGAPSLRRGVFGSVAVAAFLLTTGTSFIAPLLPRFADVFELSTLRAGLLLSAVGIGRLGFDLNSGFLTDRFGYRRIALVGCALTGAGALGAAVAQSYALLLLAQFVQGMGTALFTTAAMSLVIGLAPTAQVGRTMSQFMAVMVLSFSLGPVFGGVAAGTLGLRAPFFVYAAGAGLAFAVTAFAVPEPGGASSGPVRDRADPPSPGGRLAVVRVLLTRRAYLLAVLTAMTMYWMRAGVRNTLLPVFAAVEMGLGEIAISIVLGVAAFGNLLILSSAGRLLDSIGRRPVLIWSVFGASGVIALFAGLTSPWMLFAAAALLGIVSGYANPAPGVVLADVTASELRGTAVGILRMGIDLGIVIGPITVGALADLVGTRGAFLLSGVVVLALGVALLGIPETMPRPAVDSGRADPVEPP